MYVRKKPNRSGSTSVVTVEKSEGKVRYIKTIGVSEDKSEIEKLYRQGKKWIASTLGERDMFEEHDRCQEERQVTEHLLGNIENILLNGTQLILNPVFELTGFSKIEDSILKILAVSRICQPRIKVATVDYLKSYFDEDIEWHNIYRYLDKLQGKQQEKIQQISVEHTRNNPLSYTLFNGSQYEGKTMIPVVEDFVKRFDPEDFVVVADSGLMNKTNIALPESGGYKYIIGAGIKNESEEIKQWILSREKHDGCFYELGKLPHSRLIVGYSESRAKKDGYNREKGVKRLKTAFKSGSITKDNINKRGYNKFLDISDNIKVEINQNKISEDAGRDGLKGYVTNTELPAKEVYEQYSELWQVERAFRITRGTMELRPVFHFTPKRIEAHVCICFVAYKVYKELERILRLKGINLSVDRVPEIAKTVTTLKVRLPLSDKILIKTMIITKKHRGIAQLYDNNLGKNL